MRLCFFFFYWNESLVEPKENFKPANEEELFYVQHGREAMRKALSILEDREDWEVEIEEVTLSATLLYNSLISQTIT